MIIVLLARPSVILLRANPRTGENLLLCRPNAYSPPVKRAPFEEQVTTSRGEVVDDAVDSLRENDSLARFVEVDRRRLKFRIGRPEAEGSTDNTTDN